MGKVNVEMKIRFIGEEKMPFIRISDGTLLLAKPAKDAKAVYDEYLGTYIEYLEENAQMLISAVSGVAK